MGHCIRERIPPWNGFNLHRQPCSAFHWIEPERLLRLSHLRTPSSSAWLPWGGIWSCLKALPGWPPCQQSLPWAPRCPWVAAYYLPLVDNLLDTIAAPAAVVAGAIVSASVFTDMSPVMKWSLALIAGGSAAGIVHASAWRCSGVAPPRWPGQSSDLNRGTGRRSGCLHFILVGPRLVPCGGADSGRGWRASGCNAEQGFCLPADTRFDRRLVRRWSHTASLERMITHHLA